MSNYCDVKKLLLETDGRYKVIENRAGSTRNLLILLNKGEQIRVWGRIEGGDPRFVEE